MPFDEDLITELLGLAEYLPTVMLEVDVDDLAVLAFCVEQVRKAIDANQDSRMAAFAVAKINAMCDVLQGVMAELAAAGRANAAEAN